MDKRMFWTGIGLLVLGIGFLFYIAWIGYIQPLQKQALARESFVIAPTTLTTPSFTPTITPKASLTPPPPIPTPTPTPIREDFLLEIPSIGLEWVVHEVTEQTEEPFNISKAELDRWGVVRFPNYAFPGEIGVVALAGHRDISGSPFWRLEQVRKGDEVRITLQDTHPSLIYQVFSLKYVSPYDLTVLEPVYENSQELRLITCLIGSQQQRVVVYARISEKGG